LGRTRKLGLIINPIAGMGGSVGLKGTDGDLADRARALGAEPVAAARALTALSELTRTCPDAEIFTRAGSMGGTVARQAGLATCLLGDTNTEKTGPEDTQAIARAIIAEGAAMLLFAGGDGTARDIHEVVGDKIPMLGVPSGVKMHSAVFAATARAAGAVAARYLAADDPTSLLVDAEIMDRVDDTAAGHAPSPQLFGIARSARHGFLVPGAKASRPVAAPHALAAAVDRVAASLHDDRVSLLGPGSTMQAVASRLGFDGSPLGVDATRNGELLAADLDERRILELIANNAARIVVSVVGGQGFLFGRGNQPLSAAVIAEVGVENIVLVAALEKLVALPGSCLLVDTGSESVDDLLAGFLPVIVSDARTVMMPVKNVSRELGDDESRRESI
jgi:predicted polyphosphate/ATP-dependent NAD kinase